MTAVKCNVYIQRVSTPLFDRLPEKPMSPSDGKCTQDRLQVMKCHSVAYARPAREPILFNLEDGFEKQLLLILEG